MSCSCGIEADNQAQRKVLVILLALNLCMFVVEVIAGILSESTALLADSLDMLADATVYSISLYAVAKAPQVKINAALANGGFQLLIGLGLLFEVARRVLMAEGKIAAIKVYGEKTGVGLREAKLAVDTLES